jgi:hypothetical protein
VWTSLAREIVGYDILYHDDCGPVYFVRLWVMTFYTMTSLDQIDCEVVGYDNLYTDEFGPIYFVRLWVKTPCILTSVDQFV